MQPKRLQKVTEKKKAVLAKYKWICLIYMSEGINLSVVETKCQT